MEWHEEQPCFEGVATELSLFYADFSAYSEEAEGLMEATQKQPEEEAETGPVPVKYERLLQVRPSWAVHRLIMRVRADTPCGMSVCLPV